MNNKKSSDAQKKASVKWQKENYVRIPFDVHPEEKERIKQDAEKTGMTVGGYIKQAIAEKRERGANELTKKEVDALGWIYGRLSRALGENYDPSGVKYNNACTRPMSGVTLAHMAAIRENLVAKKLAELTLEEKVAQMFMITPEALTGVETVTKAGETTRRDYDKYPVGGIIYFQNNLKNPKQTREMLGNMEQYSRDRLGLPVFLGVDEEGGTVCRIAGNEGFSIDNVEI